MTCPLNIKKNFINDINFSTWKLINEIINKRNSKPTMTSTFKVDGKSITDPVIIAEKFCQHFSSIGSTLAKKYLLLVLPLLHSYRIIITYHYPAAYKINSNFRISVEHLNPENPLAIIYQCILSRNL